MERLTINKPVGEMGMYELAHNCCYSKDGNARFRDFEKDMDSRNFARKLMVAYGLWQDNVDCNVGASSELLFDEHFDEAMIENLMIEPTNVEGLIALFYRNLWAMADLRETLKAYEDAEEQGLLLKLECKPNDVIWVYSFPDKKYFECMVRKIEINFLRSEPIYHIMVLENCLCDIVKQEDFGKTVFFTKEEAEQALKQMGEDES